MTQVVSLDTFPNLTEKAKKFGFDEIRVCEDCYDELTSSLTTTSEAYLHPMFRSGVHLTGPEESE